MHIESGLFTDIVVLFLAAFVGGLTARSLRLPILLGYMGMGMVIGPHALGAIGDVETVQTLAEFGVILLLFAVGIEVSFSDLRRAGRAAVLIGLAQIAATVGIAYPVGILMDWSHGQAVVFGMVVALSSTLVVLKTLTDRGELGSVHGRVLTAILLVQDLAFVPMIAVLPALKGDGSAFLTDLGLGVLKASAVLGLMALLGRRAIPWLLRRVSYLGSRELFLLTVVAITFTTAAITSQVGLSAAVGAFVAGLVLSESDFGYRALSEVIPLRDAFSAVFFVSLGMLVDLAFVSQHLGQVLVVVALAVLVKFILTVGLARAFGYLPYAATLTGLGMVQIGEFSFILADAAADLGIVDQDFLSLIVASAVLTMAVTPPLIAAGSASVVAMSHRFRFLYPYRLGDEKAEQRSPPLSGHVVICGLGRVGSLVAEALAEHQIPLALIDLDPRVAARWRERKHFVIYGSGSSETVLRAARVGHARLMVLSTGDTRVAEAAVQHALRMNPGLDVVARVHSRGDGERLQRLGAGEVVWPEMEGGLEMLRHSLRSYDTDSRQVDGLVDRLRDHLSFDTQE